MYLSDFIKNGTQLQGPAGPLAINANDLTAVAAGINQLFSCQVSDFASVPNQGSQVFPTTAVSGFLCSNMRNSIYFNAVDASIFVLAPYLTTSNGMKVFKYLASGTLYNSVILDTTNSIMMSPVVTKLSNGNFLCVWAVNAGSAYFAIVDQYLNIVVAKTAIDLVDNGSFHAIALSGGGFAIAYSKSNPCNAIYDNNGAVVKAIGTLTNAAAFGAQVYMSLAQLSNGNIAYAIGSGQSLKSIGHAITSAAGANVLQVTLLDATTGGTPNRVSISTVTNNYCVAVLTNTRTAAYVLNLAGAVQGAEFVDASGGGGPNPDMKLLSDGAMFWLVYDDASNVVAVAGLPVTGTGYSTTTFATGTTHSNLDAVTERGILVFCTASIMYVVQLNGAGNACYLINTFNSDANHGGMKLLTDFSFIGWGPGNNMTGYKYLNTAILGIAQQSVAAGNAGAVISYTMGPGAYPCTALLGTVGKGFDHSSPPIVGNKGTMLGNSVSLKGI